MEKVNSFAQPGWPLLTQDNEQEVYDAQEAGKIVIFASLTEYDTESRGKSKLEVQYFARPWMGEGTMAKRGGYYFHIVEPMVLPEGTEVVSDRYI